MKPGAPTHSDVTPEPLYRSRRDFLKDTLLEARSSDTPG